MRSRLASCGTCHDHIPRDNTMMYIHGAVYVVGCSFELHRANDNKVTAVNKKTLKHQTLNFAKFIMLYPVALFSLFVITCRKKRNHEKYKRINVIVLQVIIIHADN